MNRTLIAFIAAAALALGAACASEEEIVVGDEGEVGLQTNADDFSTYLGNTYCWQGSSSAGLHKFECCDNAASACYEDRIYQGWSDSAHCGCGSGWHGGEHWSYSVSYAAQRADAYHEGCGYSWWGTCNSKDWWDHWEQCAGQGYDSHGHGGGC